MGYSWVYLGDATIPEEQRAAWLARSATQQPHGAVLGTEDVQKWRLHDPEVDYDREPVERVLATLGEEPGAIVRYQASPISIGVVRGADPTQLCRPGSPGTPVEIVVRVVASKSMDAWLTYKSTLAAAFVLLGEHGGRGTLVALGASDGPDRGFRVDASPEGASARSLTRDEVLALRRDPRFLEAERGR